MISGSIKQIYRELSIRNQIKEFGRVVNPEYVYPALYNGVKIKYIGTKNNIYPPYHLNEKCIGNIYSLWAGVSGCNLGYVDDKGGCSSFSEDNYLFEVI